MNPVLRSTPLLLALALIAGCAKHPAADQAAPAANLPPAKVRTAVVRLEEAPALLEVTGTIRPAQRALLAAKVMGTIDELPVTLGQRVHRGDVLVKISAAEIAAKVAQAQSQLNMARRDLERERDLLAKSASTADMVKSLEDRFALTQAMVREAEVMQGYATLRAPFDGVIARKNVNVGDLAAPGMPLLEVEGTSDYQVEAGIPDSLATRLRPATTVQVDIPGGGASFAARLIELSSASDAYARTVQAKFAVPAGSEVRSGQFVRLQIPGAPQPMLLAPVAAVSVQGQMERIFVVQDNRAVLRLVKTGASRAGDRVEILAGLSAPERIVLNPPAGLREGQPLEVQP